MNQDETRISKKAGQALDVVLGFRNLLGVRRLGLDLRAGVFFPGQAFRNEDPVTGRFRRADKSVSVIGKFWF